nr:glycosyltransferase [Lysobacter enzymogenes]
MCRTCSPSNCRGSAGTWTSPASSPARSNANAAPATAASSPCRCVRAWIWGRRAGSPNCSNAAATTCCTPTPCVRCWSAASPRGARAGRCCTIIHSRTDRDTENALRNRVNSAIQRFGAARAARLVAVSHGTAHYLRGLGYDDEVVRVVPNGVPVNPAPRPWIAPDGAWTLGMVALFRPRKGVEMLIDALAQLRAQGRDVSLRAVGGFESDAYREQVLAHAQARGVAEQIHWTGFTRDVSAELARIDLFVLPSLYGEGLPMVLIEALSLGLPVVATANEGVPEVLADGRAGELVPSGDATALAAAVAALMDDPARAAALAGRGCMPARALFGRGDGAPGRGGVRGSAAGGAAMNAAAPSPDAAPRRLLELLDRLLIVRDAAQYRALLQRLADPAGATVLSFFNQHAFNLAWTDPAFAEHLRRSDVLLRDGVGVAACLRLLAREPGLNANGTDLIPRLLAAFAGRRAVLIGTREPYLQRAAQRLGEDYAVEVACALDGFGDAAGYLEAVARERPDLVVLAMGMPKQERVAAELAQWARQAGHRLLIVNGGAIADFIAGASPARRRGCGARA